MALNAWGHLDNHFLSEIPTYNADWFRGPDAPHIKRNHTYGGETDVMHFHREFSTEITPKLLSFYLNKFWEQQNDPHHDKDIFKFFEDGEIDRILKAFTLYYDEYKGSSIEAMVEEKAKLTPEEELSYTRALDSHKRSDPVQLLHMLSMFRASRITVSPTSTIVHVSEENCNIM
ncbi:hypothetical protein [Legionella rowbothamii]|uniref:hypothetical protein n=1 Tax=Legionella rowbothamii TaxID=96229 RepID=UPI0010560537|nr:hypothetical protein [Legionella rowbothamii]